MQGRLDRIHALPPVLGLALLIDLRLRLLHHPQTLHPQHIGLKEGLLGLKSRLQVGDILGVACRRNLLAQLVDAVDALVAAS